ncbi:hypothetical protein Runsl_0504 [Runella slithyformis DSM 19594]|uniref:Uncharacterized protein n=1 Tax=Runella slithyformis (strain ATCC 29530 / DSM 19594 / LMG 11500 / NCIMB 11436 / LSU 4) TaxID=761193 RepID=A0A7U4E4A8_RUNSL|nr:hypothetical protein Runsl_0504 [Runella slithyformis DSM 19594]
MTNYSNDERRIENNEFTNLSKAQKFVILPFVIQKVTNPEQHRLSE